MKQGTRVRLDILIINGVAFGLKQVFGGNMMPAAEMGKYYREGKARLQDG